MNSADRSTVLELRAGTLRVLRWPNEIRPPFGLTAHGTEWVGPARLRPAVRKALAAVDVPIEDRIGPEPLESLDLPPAPVPAPVVFDAWCAHGHRGSIAGLGEARRADFVLAAIRNLLVPALVVVRDSGAQSSWQRTLRGHGIDDAALRSAAVVATATEAARSMHWRARRHDLLVVDRPEQQPGEAIATVLDGSPALARVGFVDRATADVVRWSSGLGAVVGTTDESSAPRRLELRLPLTEDERAVHDAAWHVFLRSFDAFVALRPNAGFGTFVQQARGDPTWRDSLLAWHRALQAASWNTAKRDACAALLRRHRGERVVVFTPDRRSAYELARDHLVAPVTAELPRRERDATLAAFAQGRIRSIAGPRLLDLGVAEGTADVGILVGGGFGSAQHAARCRRVAVGGIVYELVAIDTQEVGRARRFGRPPARSAAGVDVDGR